MNVCSEIQHGTAAYDQTVSLRDDVLRRPLGLVFTPDELAAEHDSFHLACWRGETLVGCVVLTPLGAHRIRMRQLAVRTEDQGQGIGRALVAFSECLARDHGYREMILHARDTAIGFYDKLGYRTEGDPFVEVTIPHVAMTKGLTGREEG